MDAKQVKSTRAISTFHRAPFDAKAAVEDPPRFFVVIQFSVPRIHSRARFPIRITARDREKTQGDHGTHLERPIVCA